MARILIAADSEAIAGMERILGPGHELTTATKLEEALSELKENSFDLITIGVHFDESRMFELLPLTRTEKNATTPTICFCTRDTAMTRVMHESIDVTTQAFGAWMYLDQHKYNVLQDPDAEIRRVIERCLTDDARKTNLLSRIDIQTQRARIMQLRLALDAEEWSVKLEDELSDLRRELAQVLLQLSKLHVNAITQYEQIAISRSLKDRVSSAVDTDEHGMTGRETAQTLTETKQSMQEQLLVETEETKGKEGRRMLDDGLRKQA